MSKKLTVIFAASIPGSRATRRLRSLPTVRLLAFLAMPSNETWGKLCAQPGDMAGQRPTDSPFSHACGNGSNREGVAGCINGFDHGRFATRAEKESHKMCTNGARVLCPGHGLSAVKCYFVHENGMPKPCLNVSDYLPIWWVPT